MDALRLYTLTEIARLLGRDYRGLKKQTDFDPVAVTSGGGYEIKLFSLEQFGLEQETEKQ